MGECTLILPKSCPIQTVVVEGPAKYLKEKACLEACKKLHQIGALNDNLVPDTVIEKKLLLKKLVSVTFIIVSGSLFPCCSLSVNC